MNHTGVRATGSRRHAAKKVDDATSDESKADDVTRLSCHAAPTPSGTSACRSASLVLAPYCACMMTRTTSERPPIAFARALEQLRSARLRPEVALVEVPAPQRIAPYAVALTADVLTRASAVGAPAIDAEAPDELASGRFVLLHDPSAPEPWHGTFRAVTFVRAELEPEFGADPMLGEVGWSWLREALVAREARFTHDGGTVTRVVSQSFGALSERPASVELEVRGSWTPLGDDLGLHLQGWADLLCTVGGLPPLPDGVTALPGRRR